MIKREAISIISDSGRSGVRSRYGIPLGTASDVTIIQDDSTCQEVMSAFEATVGTPMAEMFIIIRMGQSSPFWLLTPRVDTVPTSRYLLDSQFKLLVIVGTDG